MSQHQRPQSPPQISSVASDFGAALDSIFDTSESLFSLSVGLQQKQEAISSQSRELEALEEQLKATEQRLKKAKRASLAAQGGQGSPTAAAAAAAAAASAATTGSTTGEGQSHQIPMRPAHAPPPIPHKISEASLASQYSAHQQASRPMTAMSSKSQRTASQRA